MTDRFASRSQPWHVSEEEDAWLGQLARAAQEGDRAARDALWMAVAPRLTRVASHAAWAFLTLEPDDAVQESFPIFAALVATWPGPHVDGTGFAIYLFGMFRWRLHTALRAYERRQSANTDWSAHEERLIVRPPHRTTWHEYGVDLAAFLADLPESERSIFLLRVRDGLATREIAARLSVSPRTVSRYYNRTLRRLRALAQRASQ